MSTIGDALLRADPPIEAMIVYNSNPVAVAPDSSEVIAGFAREDLFTVVLEHFQTDTADYADILLPATTQLEHLDIHTSYGHRYWVMNRPAIAPLGEALPNTEIFRRLARKHGFCRKLLRRQRPGTGGAGDRPSGQQHAAQPCAIRRRAVHAASATGADDHARQLLAPLLKQGWLKMDVAAAPFAEGGFPTPSGKVEFFSSRLEAKGEDPVPDYLPPYESVASNPELAARFPLSLISPPARNFLNSTFANVASLKAAEKDQQIHLNPLDAQRRGISDGMPVTVFNDRGRFTARAVVTDASRPGRGHGARGLVAQAQCRRAQCQHGHAPAPDRPGQGADVL